MWQRKQTLFLAISGAVILSMLFFPLWSAHVEDTKYMLYPLCYVIDGARGMEMIYYPYSVTAILAVASITLILYSILSYRDRMKQLKIGMLNSLFIAGTLVSATYFASQLNNSYEADGYYGPAIYFPVVALIGNFIANRLIRRDERLVRNSDRLR